MASGRSRSGNLAVRPAEGSGRRRGFVSVVQVLPRLVRIKTLASGAIAFYWDLTGYYRALGCSIPGEPLGTNYVTACGDDGNGGRAAALNALFDEWKRSRSGEPVEGLVRFLGRSIGYSANTSKRRRILRKFRCVRAVTTSGPCCWSRI